MQASTAAALDHAGAAQEAEAAAPGDVIDVAFGVDDRFVPHLAAVIASLLAASPGARFRFFVLHPGVDPERRRLVESVAPGTPFVWLEVSDSDVPSYKERGHLTRATLFRLGLEKLAPADCRRVIYLDSDMIVMADLRRLWVMDLEGRPIGAVPDTFAYLPEYPISFMSRFGLSPDKGAYMNAGVLLIDLDSVRRERSFTKAIDLLAAHGDELVYGDQDAINAVFWGRFKNLGNEWNASRDRAVHGIAQILPEHLRLNGRPPAIVHYTDKFKPWIKDGYHPWSWLYWRHLARTPFFREVAQAQGMGWLTLARLWLRWLRRRPTGALT